RIDIAIRHGKLEDSGFAARALARVRYLPVCSPSFAATTGLPDHPSQLAALPLLSFSYPGFASHWQAQQGKDSMAVPITPVIRAGNADILRAAAVDGLGIALLADWTVREDLQVGRLVPVLPDWQFGPQGEEDESRLWMLFPSRRYVSAKARLFADFLSVHMRSQTASEA
ncbi:MAG: substrate binding domain-containing protein, partial [Rhodospirillaceae bacterium]